MRLIAILIVVILSFCATAYHPTETPPVEVDIPMEAPQQEQDNTPAVVEETAPDVAEALLEPQESDPVPATDTDAFAGTAESFVKEGLVEKENELLVEMMSATVGTVRHLEETTIAKSSKTGTPSVVEHAKIGYESEDTSPAELPATEPEMPAKSANIDEAIAAAEAFAIETYNVTIDPTLNFNNSAYRFPAAVPLTVNQDTLNYKAIDIVDYTFQQQIRQYDVTIEKMRETGIRCRVYVEKTENDLLIYCLHA